MPRAVNATIREFALAALAALAVTFGAGFSAGCGEAPPVGKSEAASATPPLALTFHSSESAPEQTVASAPPATPNVAAPVASEAARAEAASLTTEWQTATEESRRLEILWELAINGSSPARQTLETIYRTAPDAETRQNVIEALALIPADELGQAILLLQEAAKPTQPREMRDAVVETLQDLDSSKMLPVWQILLSDPAPEIRETAKAAVEYSNAP